MAVVGRALNLFVIFVAYIAAVNACTLCADGVFSGDGYAQKTYTSSDADVLNPERGWAVLNESFDDGGLGDEAPLTAESLQYLQTTYGAVSVIWRMWYLDFLASVPSAYLELIQADFDVLRENGFKATIRFAYTDNPDAAGTSEQAPDKIDNHIDELTAVLRVNLDVIMSVQIGFIGVWGQWYYTDQFGDLGVITADEWVLRRAVFNQVATAVTGNRPLQLRTPTYKREVTEVSTAMTANEYRNNEDRFRIGFHNDCFLSSANDTGTYDYIDADYAYLETETKYVIMGGTTCAVNAPRSQCTTAKEELAKFHWTYLNIVDDADVIASWRSGGCFEEISKKLGYRLRLVSASLPNTVTNGSDACFKVILKNDGYAAPVNPREVKVVLRSTSGSFINYTSDHISVFTDAEPWLPESGNIPVIFSLKIDVPPGDYNVLLELNDPLLPANPSYSIILLNDGVPELETALNNLGHTITVTADDTTGVCNGFSEKANTNSTTGTRCASSCSGLRYGSMDGSTETTPTENGATSRNISSVIFSCLWAVFVLFVLK